MLIIAIYVADGIIFAKDKTTIKKVLKQLSEEFEIHVMDTNTYLGFQIIRGTGHDLIIHQSSYINKILTQ